MSLRRFRRKYTDLDTDSTADNEDNDNEDVQNQNTSYESYSSSAATKKINILISRTIITNVAAFDQL